MSDPFSLAITNERLLHRRTLLRHVNPQHQLSAQKIRDLVKLDPEFDPRLLSSVPSKRARSINEEDTIDRFVSPILKSLGYYARKKYGDEENKFPDIWLFQQAPPDFEDKTLWTKNLTILEAKPFTVNLDKGDGRPETPPMQISKYITTNSERNALRRWGILTNGHKWRLYELGNSTSYFEFSLAEALEDAETLELFCLVFSPDSFQIKEDHSVLLSLMREESLRSWVRITDELEKRGSTVLLTMLQGVYHEQKSLTGSQSYAYTVLFRLFYIAYIESKYLNMTASVAYAQKSLHCIVDDMYRVHHQEYRLCERVSELFALYKVGKGILPDGFGGEHFDQHLPLLMNNSYTQKLLELLFLYEEDESGRRCFFDFSSLNVELVGNIYEGTLSWNFKVVDETVVKIQNKHRTGTTVHSTGTTYTPSSVVKCLVDEALTDSKIARPKICDPACGSGHFLVQALRRLTEQQNKNISENCESIEQIKRDLAVDCLFGVDTNELAVSLARLMLAIETSAPWMPAVNFSKNILHFNALTVKWRDDGDWLRQFDNEEIHRSQGFDYVVGNPPYVRADAPGLAPLRRSVKASEQYCCLYKKWDMFVPFVELALGLTKQTKGIVAFVVSDGITYTDFAAPLRDAMHESGHLKKVYQFGKAFDGWAFPGTCFVYDWRHSGQAERKVHSGNVPGLDAQSTMTGTPLLKAGSENVQALTKRWLGLTLSDIAYVSVGMVLNSHEKYLGTDKEFEKANLISRSAPDKSHPCFYLESEDLQNGFFSHDRLLSVEYGPGLRAPAYIRRPTFPELHTGPRILLGRSKRGGKVALTTEDIVVSDNTIVIKLWRDLPDDRLYGKKLVLSKGLVEPMVGRMKLLMNAISQLVDGDLILSILMSSTYLNWIKNDQRHKHNVVPDVVSDFPIPISLNVPSSAMPKKKFDLTFVSTLERLRQTPDELAQVEICFHLRNLMQKILKEKTPLTSSELTYLDELVYLLYRPVFRDTFNNAFSLSSILSTLRLPPAPTLEAGQQNTKPKNKRLLK